MALCGVFLEKQPIPGIQLIMTKSLSRSSNRKGCNALIVEDDVVSSSLISRVVDSAGLQPRPFGSFASLRAGDLKDAAVAIVDLSLPDRDGIEIIRWLKGQQPGLPCLVVTAENQADRAVRAMKSGADDYFVKPFDFEALMQAVQSAAQVEAPSFAKMGGVVWKSDSMRRVAGIVKQVAGSEASVMITGPEGCGKSRIARWIHSEAGRAADRLGLYRCPNEPSDDGVVRLFGSPESGRFFSVSPGLLESRHFDSVLIEGIERLAAVSSSMLIEHLSQIETGTRDLPRIITTSRLSPKELIHSGLEKKLVHGLSSVHIEVPPLNAIPEDIGNWARLLLTELSFRHGNRLKRLTDGAWALIETRRWDGNLPELRKVLEGAIATSGQDLIAESDIQSQFSSSEVDGWMRSGDAEGLSINRLERNALVHALAVSKGNRKAAAKLLGVSLRTVYYMIKRHGL